MAAAAARNDEFLRHLGLQRAGQIRPQAEVVLPEAARPAGLGQPRHGFMETVAFDGKCEAPGQQQWQRPAYRHRGHGEFVVAGVRLSRLGTL